jgi:hypothetical protein
VGIDVAKEGLAVGFDNLEYLASSHAFTPEFQRGGVLWYT